MMTTFKQVAGLHDDETCPLKKSFNFAFYRLKVWRGQKFQIDVECKQISKCIAQQYIVW